MAVDPCYIASARTAQRTPLSTPVVACMSVTAITWQRPLFTEPLLSNGYCTAAYFEVVV
jgi:hypothetical protein